MELLSQLRYAGQVLDRVTKRDPVSALVHTGYRTRDSLDLKLGNKKLCRMLN